MGVQAGKDWTCPAGEADLGEGADFGAGAAGILGVR